VQFSKRELLACTDAMIDCQQQPLMNRMFWAGGILLQAKDEVVEMRSAEQTSKITYWGCLVAGHETFNISTNLLCACCWLNIQQC